MIDIHGFGRAFTEKLLTISAENIGVSRIEAVRKYHTDGQFKAMVDTIVRAAVDVISDQEQVEGFDPLRDTKEIFQQEAAQMLGWRH